MNNILSLSSQNLGSATRAFQTTPIHNAVRNYHQSQAITWMWCCIVWWVGSSILEEPAASVFRVDGNISRILYKTTWLHIPDLSPCNFCLFSQLKQALRAPDFCQISTSRPQNCSDSSSNLRSSLLRDAFSWCVNGIPASVPMVTIFSGLSFAQNNPWCHLSYDKTMSHFLSTFEKIKTATVKELVSMPSCENFVVSWYKQSGLHWGKTADMVSWICHCRFELHFCEIFLKQETCVASPLHPLWKRQTSV
jgi:hypothetical protein